MTRATFSLSMAAAAAALLSMAVSAETLYAVSVRTYSDPGYAGVEGNLYIVDPERAATTLVTPLSVDGKTPVGLDGLAIHPRTGVFYGITAPSSSVIPRSLVKFDPKEGNVTLIGDLGHIGSDIAFDKDGTLFVWLPDTRQVGEVNLDSGAVVPRGRAGTRGAPKGGFALIGSGRALVAATGGSGTLDTVDMATGEITAGPELSGARFPDLISGLAYSSKGVLFAINTNFGRSSLANLVTIDVKTGKVTNIGPLPNDTDALTFGPSTKDGDLAANWDQWRLPVLLALFVLAIGVVIVAVVPKKK
ncbi:MAG: hypothetical protein ACXWAC_13295 [Usitatibacter sp.]